MVQIILIGINHESSKRFPVTLGLSGARVRRGGEGSQIWIGWGCAASSLGLIPMFKGNFCHKNTLNCQNFQDSHFCMKKGTYYIGISFKKPTQKCGTSLYVLTCVYPQAPSLLPNHNEITKYCSKLILIGINESSK